MKKIFLFIFFEIIAFVCGANEYTVLLKEKSILINEINQIESKMKEPWRWVKYSINANLNFRKQLEIKKAKLKDVISDMSKIENHTIVTITSIELRGIPDFDRFKIGKGNADLRIYFQNHGSGNSFVSRDNCGSDIACNISENINKNDIIEIKDEDLSGFEDMGQIQCHDIFSHALKNDSSDGTFHGQIFTGNGSYTYIIKYYKRSN